MAYFRTCKYCGATLDPGECCDCRANEAGRYLVPDGYELRKGRDIVKLLNPPEQKPGDKGTKCTLVEIYKLNFQE